MMKILGLDLGSTTLGIAMSDASGKISGAKETYKFKPEHYKHAVEYVAQIVKKENISKIVLGLPKNMDNTEGKRCIITRHFAKKVEDATGIAVVLWDERLTTIQANQILIESCVRSKNRKRHVDKIVATIILQSYLDSKN